MIKGVTFEKLDKTCLSKKTYPYNPNILTNSITHINDIAILPSDCYPSVNMNGVMFQDNLCNLYESLFIAEDKSDIALKVQEELVSRWGTGKTGRWRQDICGKRCNFTARSVLSPNPLLSLTQIGLPSIWKNTLTLVDFWKPNFKVIAVIDDHGRKYDPRFRKPSRRCKVIRQLQEGELVIINRQPTLRESNLVAMHVVWTNGKTIQMHPGLFSMFDADCDGDEINVHLPQIPQNELECVHIKHAIWYYGDSSLGPSVVQDATVGLCLNDMFKNKTKIHNRIIQTSSVKTEQLKILNNIQRAYTYGTKKAYEFGFSVGFDFKEVDFMIDVGAKGKKIHKERIRLMLNGVYDDDIHFQDCQDARIAMMSTSLKTAETGYVSRRMAYHFDDIKQDKNGFCTDYDTMYIQYPKRVPEKYRHIRNIGLHLVMTLMPPLTQKMLDSFHAASVGEKIENKTKTFVSLVNCSSVQLKEIYKSKGILLAKKWLFKEIKDFFDNAVKDFWIQLLVNILCVTGKPIGIDMTSLVKRCEAYLQFDNTMTLPIIKLCKYGSPIKILQQMANKNSHDNLSSNHSREFFF